jgi:hypothetical protein
MSRSITAQIKICIKTKMGTDPFAPQSQFIEKKISKMDWYHYQQLSMTYNDELYFVGMRFERPRQ